MKRYLISMVAVLVVLAVAWGAFAQDEETPAQGVQRERRAQAEIARQRFQNMSEEEREKYRAEMRAMREKFENMSEEEREKFRAEMRERFGAGRPVTGRQEQLKAVEAIEELVAKLKAAIEAIPGREDRSRFRDLSEEERTNLRGKMAKAGRERQTAIRAIEQLLAKLRGPARPQPQVSFGELRTIHDLAVKEKATQTTRRLERLIARYQRESGDREREPGQRPERLERPPRERPDRERPARERPARQRRDVQDESSGRRAPAFELNSFDGKTVSLSDYRGKIVVLEWFNFECPLSLYHYKTKNTMVELANKYKDKNVVWFAVNSTNHTTQGPNKTFTEKYKLPFVILDDRSGKVGRAYGAETTPHMYIINPRGRIVYEGAIDDNRRIDPKKKDVVNYVDKALSELTAGKAISMAKTKPYGCTVKYAQ